METSGKTALRERAPQATPTGNNHRLQVVIPYTTQELTEAALRTATPLVGGLGAAARLIYVVVVPYPRGLDQPHVASEHLQAKLTDMVRDSTFPVRAELVYARDRVEGFQCVIGPGSLVLLATKRRWWPTAEERLGRALSRVGHSVALFAV